MDKGEVYKKYPKEEDRLVIAKIWDKIELCKVKNKLAHTDFLDLYQKSIAENLMGNMLNLYINLKIIDIFTLCLVFQ